MEKINLEKVKKALTDDKIITLLVSLGATIHTNNSKEIICNAICHHAEPNNKKLYWYKESKQFYCFSKCSRSYSPFDLVKKVKNISFVDSIYYICDICDIKVENVKRFKPKKKDDNWEEELEKYTKFRSGASIFKEYDKSILSFFEKKYPLSWLEEGISKETMEKYKICYYPFRNQTLIPCMNEEGKLIGIRVRNWNPQETNKYMPLYLLDGSNFTFSTNNYFYGINYNQEVIKNKKTVWLVEGEKSVLKADTWMKENNLTLAMYGKTLGIKRRNQLLKLGVNKVILMIDSDFHTIGDNEFKEFEKNVFKISKLFKGYCRVEVVYNNIGLNGYKYSPFDFTKEEFKKLYKNREILLE